MRVAAFVTALVAAPAVTPATTAVATSFATMAAASVLLGACASPWADESADLDRQDSATALRIKSALIDEPSLAGAAIDVEFSDGRARLTGFVETREQRVTAARVAREQQGVKRVVDEIVVK
jgi:osmotically-inducible protein OsmY